MRDWGVDDVCDWLEHEVGLPQYSDMFRECGITGTTLEIVNGFRALFIPRENVMWFIMVLTGFAA